MNIMEEQNSLQISVNSEPVNEKNTKYSNSAGRPKKFNEIKFSPQPRSIVSQLLKEEKTRKMKQDVLRIKEISEECDAPEYGFTISDEPEVKKQSTSQSIKTYNCEHPLCTYTTSMSSNLIKHKRKHTSEKPYMCDQCTFRSNFINSLTVHKRIHTGERPFVCKHCNYRSNSSSNLKKHCLHKHTGIT